MEELAGQSIGLRKWRSHLGSCLCEDRELVQPEIGNVWYFRCRGIVGLDTICSSLCNHPRKDKINTMFNMFIP